MTGQNADPGFGTFADWQRIAWPHLTEAEIEGGWRPLRAPRKAAWALIEKRATDAEAEVARLRELLGEVLDDLEHVVGGNAGYIDRDMLADYRQRGRLPASS